MMIDCFPDSLQISTRSEIFNSNHFNSSLQNPEKNKIPNSECIQESYPKLMDGIDLFHFKNSIEDSFASSQAVTELSSIQQKELNTTCFDYNKLLSSALVNPQLSIADSVKSDHNIDYLTQNKNFQQNSYTDSQIYSSELDSSSLISSNFISQEVSGAETNSIPISLITDENLTQPQIYQEFQIDENTNLDKCSSLIQNKTNQWFEHFRASSLFSENQVPISSVISTDSRANTLFCSDGQNTLDQQGLGFTLYPHHSSSAIIPLDCSNYLIGETEDVLNQNTEHLVELTGLPVGYQTINNVNGYSTLELANLVQFEASQTSLQDKRLGRSQNIRSRSKSNHGEKQQTLSNAYTMDQLGNLYFEVSNSAGNTFENEQEVSIYESTQLPNKPNNNSQRNFNTNGYTTPQQQKPKITSTVPSISERKSKKTNRKSKTNYNTFASQDYPKFLNGLTPKNELFPSSESTYIYSQMFDNSLSNLRISATSNGKSLQNKPFTNDFNASMAQIFSPNNDFAKNLPFPSTNPNSTMNGFFSAFGNYSSGGNSSFMDYSSKTKGLPLQPNANSSYYSYSGLKPDLITAGTYNCLSFDENLSKSFDSFENFVCGRRGDGSNTGFILNNSKNKTNKSRRGNNILKNTSSTNKRKLSSIQTAISDAKPNTSLINVHKTSPPGLTINAVFSPKKSSESKRSSSIFDDSASVSSSCTDSVNLGLAVTTYFWQYNAQCKGPKAVRLIGDGTDSPSCGTPPPYDQTNPPVRLSSALNSCPVAPFSLPAYPLVVFEDPVQKRHDLVHCSKLRRGDGNDVTPNLNRLRTMGDELERLNSQIAQQGEIIMAGQPGGVSTSIDQEPSINSTSGAFGLVQRSFSQSPNLDKRVEEAKREKNKLASKICRLKKKAFHESNKIKYTGLALEYSELSSIMTQLRPLILQRINVDQECANKCKKTDIKTEDKDTLLFSMDFEGSLYDYATKLKQSIHVTHVAGRTDLFVDEVLSLTRNKGSRNQHPLVQRLATGNQLSSVSNSPGTIGTIGVLTYGEALARNASRSEALNTLKGIAPNSWLSLADQESSRPLIGFSTNQNEPMNDLTTQAFLAATSQQQQQEHLSRIIAIQQANDINRSQEPYDQMHQELEAGGYVAVDLSQFPQFQLAMQTQGGAYQVQQGSQQYHVESASGEHLGNLILGPEYIYSGSGTDFSPLVNSVGDQQFQVIDLTDQQQQRSGMELNALLSNGGHQLSVAKATNALTPETMFYTPTMNSESDDRSQQLLTSNVTPEYDSSNGSSAVNATNMFNSSNEECGTSRSSIIEDLFHVNTDNQRLRCQGESVLETAETIESLLAAQDSSIKIS